MTTLQSLALTFSAAFVASLGLTGVVRAVARRWGILDCPDGKRKLHPHQVPLWGGVAVYLAMVVGLVVARLGTFGTGVDLDELVTALLPAAGFVCLFGCIDDACRLRARVKLFLQIGSVLPIVLAGYYVHRIIWFGCTIEFGWLGVPLTVLWLVGCINAINLLDGMDGLASMVGVFTAGTLGIIAWCIGNDYVAVIAMVLAAALGGFLVHNLPPARIFLGDSGSMVIGLVAGILGIQSTLKVSATLSITAPLVVMTFPFFDTMLAVVRRKLTGRRFDSADRQHIHHRLLDRGMNPWLALAIIGALSLGTGMAAALAVVFQFEAVAWMTALLLVVLVVRLRLFGHHELALAAGALTRLLAALTARAAGCIAISGLHGGRDLQQLSFEDAWAILVERVRPWKVRQLQLVVSDADGSRWEQTWTGAGDPPSAGCFWTLAVTVRSPDGRSCELRAASPDTAGPEFVCSSGLARVLNLFAVHFARQVEQGRSSPVERKAA